MWLGRRVYEQELDTSAPLPGGDTPSFFIYVNGLSR